MNYNPALQQLTYAVNALAEADGDLRERLIAAWEQLGLLGRADVFVPPSIAAEVESAWRQIDRSGRWLGSLNEAELHAEARRLIRWYAAVSSEHTSR